MRRDAQIIGLVGLCFVGSLRAIPTPPPELSIVLQPDNFVSGAPQAFTITLTNVSDKDLRLPQPNLGCSNPTATGSIHLNISWQPSKGPGLSSGYSVCDFVGTGRPAPPIVERVLSWKLLHPGEKLSLTETSKSLSYDTTNNGRYTFSATYLPPVLKQEDKQQLLDRDIAVPRLTVTSNTLVYDK